MVEFALVLPMLIVLLLGIADFARVFQAGIVLEAAARNGAEVAAIERLRNKPPTDPSLVDAYYAHLHDMAAQTACAESRGLPNTTYVADDPLTSTPDDDACAEWPVIAVCVQDGQDPLCGDLAAGYVGTPPAECDEFSEIGTLRTPDAVMSHSVEVAVCYQFTTLMNLQLDLPFGSGLSLGNVFLERNRAFVVDCPPPDLTGC
jgi:hypothetical protein